MHAVGQLGLAVLRQEAEGGFPGLPALIDVRPERLEIRPGERRTGMGENASLDGWPGLDALRLLRAFRAGGRLGGSGGLGAGRDGGALPSTAPGKQGRAQQE
ncbi:hypothetical protein AVXHC19_26160 [Acidovorax sacchari]